MSVSTWVTIISTVLAVLTLLTPTQLDALWPGHGTQLAVYISIAVLALGQIINALSKQTKGQPQTGVQVGPLAQSLPIVDTAGTKVATNLSTTSTEPFQAPVSSTQLPK